MQKTLLAAALLLGAVVVAGYWIDRAQQKELQAHAAENARWQATLQLARERLDAAKAEEVSAEAALAEARARVAQLEASPARLWSVRVKLLRQLLTELPAQGLPEVRLLDSLDWINVVRTAELDTPNNIRAALAALRAAARVKFAKPLQDALKAFTERSGGKLPADIRELAPFLSAPADMEMLERYNLTRAGMVGAKDETLIKEKDTSDMILSVSLESWGMTNGSNLMPAPGESELQALERIAGAIGGAAGEDASEAAQQYARSLSELMQKTIPRLEAELGKGFDEQMKQATQRFRAAKTGEELAHFGQLLPYLDDAGKFVALIRPMFAELDFIKEHDGKLPSDPAQLKRYLARPFNAAEALRLFKVELSADGEHGSINISLGPN
jgi:hypothetical protein